MTAAVAKRAPQVPRESRKAETRNRWREQMIREHRCTRCGAQQDAAYPWRMCGACRERERLKIRRGAPGIANPGRFKSLEVSQGFCPHPRCGLRLPCDGPHPSIYELAGSRRPSE